MAARPETTSDHVTTVRTFLDGLVEGDLGVLDLLDVDAEWRNTGLPTLKGSKVGAGIRSMFKRGIGFDYVMHSAAADGDTVLTDRTDVLRLGRFEMTFWVRGTFEMRHGKILVWDDRYSPPSLAGAALLGAVRAVLPR